MSECKNDGPPSMPTNPPNCGATSPGGGSRCMLPEWHAGDHAVYTISFVCAVWPPALPPELDALLLKAQDLAEEMRKHNLTHLGQLQLR